MFKNKFILFKIIFGLSFIPILINIIVLSIQWAYTNKKYTNTDEYNNIKTYIDKFNPLVLVMTLLSMSIIIIMSATVENITEYIPVILFILQFGYFIYISYKIKHYYATIPY